MNERAVFLLGPSQVELRAIPRQQPDTGEILVQIEAATTCGTDLKVYLRGGHPRMLKTPCRFGHEMTGVIAAVGAGVTEWHEGEPVIIANSASCGHCSACLSGRENLCEDLIYLNGAFAESILVPRRFVDRSLHRRPPELSARIAPLAEPLACVLHGVEMISLPEPKRALVLGAGPIGLMFVIELRRLGIEVVLGDLSPHRLEVGGKLGAKLLVQLTGDHGIDREKLRSQCGSLALIVEATGRPEAWLTSLEIIAPGGEVILFGGCAPGTTVDCDTHRLHYSEIAIRGVYHHRPATFVAAVSRLAEDSEDFSALISEEQSLDKIGDSLERMAEQLILKACIRPEFS